MTKPLTAILGCGPSGLLAAYTLESYGVPFTIVSKKQKSILGGAQFSHIGVPGLADERDVVELTYRVRGDSATYQRKVYGSSEVPFVSFDNVSDGKVVKAWNLRQMYNMLWDSYEDRIVDHSFNGAGVQQFSRGFDVVFSSVPAPLICMGTSVNSHWFRQHPIRIYNGLLTMSGEQGRVEANNTIVYDGTDDVSWYRQSLIFGTGGTEWGGDAALPPLPDVRTVNKPISTNCDCHPNVVRIGRFGTWTKGVLTFHAYNKVLDVLEGWGVER